jgi:hypothetical protein
MSKKWRERVSKRRSIKWMPSLNISVDKVTVIAEC